jgi:hypothetical protein
MPGGTPDQKSGLKIPKWVPAPIRCGRFSAFDNPVCRRLLTDKRMRRVWAELTRRKRVAYKPTEKLLHEGKWLLWGEIPTRFDDRLAGFFFWALQAAVHKMPTLTRAEVALLSKFEKNSSWKKPYILVQRRTPKDDVRSYVCELVLACEVLFDSPLYSTIATTASVALEKPVSAEDVRRTVRQRPRLRLLLADLKRAVLIDQHSLLPPLPTKK